MATIYRFLVENKITNGDRGGRNATGNESTKTARKSASKKGRYVSLLGGSKGGVEHNRKLRAINPVINKATNGMWERGMRVGRAGMGLITKNTETGAIGVSWTAINIIVGTGLLLLLKYLNKARVKADKENAQDFKALENGYGALHSEYNVTRNYLTGRVNYNQNK